MCSDSSCVYSYFYCYIIVGKSNLMDAISFVLGEKTSNLRVKRLSVSKCQGLK